MAREVKGPQVRYGVGGPAPSPRGRSQSHTSRVPGSGGRASIPVVWRSGAVGVEQRTLPRESLFGSQMGWDQR
jgi:hypothetical protein